MKFSNNDGQNHIRNNTVFITCMFRSYLCGVGLKRLKNSSSLMNWVANKKRMKNPYFSICRKGKYQIIDHKCMWFIFRSASAVKRLWVTNILHIELQRRKVERVNIYTFLKCFRGTNCLMYMSKNVTQKTVWYYLGTLLYFIFLLK